MDRRPRDTRRFIVTPNDLAEALRRQGDLKKAFVAERERLEALFTSGREWPLQEFHERFVQHAFTGWLGRRLFWMVCPLRGEPFIGLPTSKVRAFETPTGPVEVDDEAMVRPWHPSTASASEIEELRRYAKSLSLVQPFRQVWRETYRPDDVELSLELYSSRYAGHILRFRQFYTLARKRGWSGGFLSGAWDGGQSGIASRDFQAAGVRASWSVAVLELDDQRIEIELSVTDRVLFLPFGETEPAPLPISEVPKVVFSEAMRDLDLFTSVCTVANDPFWIERFALEPRLREYWEAMAHGGLTDAIAHRREMLISLLQDVSQRERIELAERYLVVRGTLRTYYVDLATANVKMDPPGKWLSFGSKATQLEMRASWASTHLPAMDDDVILARILARASVLANDDQIRDRSLRGQIRDR